MTEVQWQNSNEPEPMLVYLHGKGSDRKFRLLACACARRIWSLLAVREWRLVVAMAEAYADGLETRTKLTAAANDACRPFVGASDWPVERRKVSMLGQVAGENAWAGAWNVVSDVRAFGNEASLPDWRRESVRQATILRHLFGNPFRPYPPPAHWPTDVVQLGEAVYGGADASFALADALLETGHPDLAEHFRSEQAHPKGCWVLDMVTCRK